MEDYGTVNSRITDSVSQAFAQVVANAPSESQGLLDTLMAETLGMAMYNAVNSQHNAQMVSTASVTAACARMLKTPLAAAPVTASMLPRITGSQPSIIPVSQAAQQIVILASAFEPYPPVTIFNTQGVLVATSAGTKSQMQYEQGASASLGLPILNSRGETISSARQEANTVASPNQDPAPASSQIQIVQITANSLTISTAAFTAPGEYDLQISTPVGTSALYRVAAQVVPPSVTDMTWASPVLTVHGSSFQTNVTATVSTCQTNGASTPLTVSGTTTATTVQLQFSPVPIAGTYWITLTNPDGGQCTFQTIPIG